ncbi:MAG: nucleotidyl transferase AbiEii/AbiGii toxin family protein [Fibrobacteria bacterium]|nr:nucleotidyl transferase AbiEii/AbiGii toxin family protein [Fibrobacteria bacterium]
MEIKKWKIIEDFQKLIVTSLARNPVGYKLYLIGGYRFRLVDDSCRFSRDIDYYWEGNLEDKQVQIVDFLNQRIVPEIISRYGYQGRAQRAIGPASESSVVRTIDLAFWQENIPQSRIEIPVDIMKFDCSEKPVVKTVQGVILPTPSDKDMIESKVIALLNRWPLQERDFIDLFLFEKKLEKSSDISIRAKLTKYIPLMSTVRHKLKGMREMQKVHIRAIDEIIKNQLEPNQAVQLVEGGGGAFVFSIAMTILEQCCLNREVDAE